MCLGERGYRSDRAMHYPSDMDAECVPICDALNELPGIRTDESCCGHGRQPHRVFFTAKTIPNLLPVLRGAHSSAWKVEAFCANGSDTAVFMLQGPIGPADMPGGANNFALWVRNAEAAISR